MHQILCGKDVLRYFPGDKIPTQTQVQKMISRLLKHWQTHNYGLWAVELRQSHTFLGRCGLQYLPDTDEVEVDFILDRNHWGEGFATEAGLASLQFGFEAFNFQQIVGIVHTGNIASQRVLEKIGMRCEEEANYFGMDCFRYVCQNNLPSGSATAVSLLI